MKTEIFKYENGAGLRVLPQLENETAWFVASDICAILGLANTSQTIDRLDEDERLMYKLYISGQERETWCINEYGLYSLILSSTKPEAKKFKRWITHEVLPAIRKAGKYTTEEMNLREESIQKIIADIDELEAEIKELKNQASEKDRLLKAKQTELKILLKADIRQLKLPI